jgi:hypothetical protein
MPNGIEPDEPHQERITSMAESEGACKVLVTLLARAP